MSMHAFLAQVVEHLTSDGSPEIESHLGICNGAETHNNNNNVNKFNIKLATCIFNPKIVGFNVGAGNCCNHRFVIGLTPFSYR